MSGSFGENRRSRRLEGRVAIVTGGSSGIGRGVVLRLAEEGARVVVSDLREEPRRGKYHEVDTVIPTAEVVRQGGGEAMFVQADVASDDELEQLISGTVERYGGLDILVNNAGIHIPGTSESLSIEDWDRVMRVNLRALFVATKIALPHLRRWGRGRIIHIASVHAYGGGAGPAYAPAKAAVVNLARDTAIEAGRDRVTVNVICPGYIETAIQDYLTQEQIDGVSARTPLPRLGLPSDIAAACAFFASDDAEWITGASLVIDGGFIAPV